MPKRPRPVADRLESGWVARTEYTPTVYRKTIPLGGGWEARLLSVRKASELYSARLCFAGVGLDPCPVRAENPELSGEWLPRQKCLELLDLFEREARDELPG
jgi:hypothetical protein